MVKMVHIYYKKKNLENAMTYRRFFKNRHDPTPKHSYYYHFYVYVSDFCFKFIYVFFFWQNWVRVYLLLTTFAL